MTKKETQMLQIFRDAFRQMTEAEKDKFLAFGEGMAFIIQAQRRAKVKGEK